MRARLEVEGLWEARDRIDEINRADNRGAVVEQKSGVVARERVVILHPGPHLQQVPDSDTRPIRSREQSSPCRRA